MCHRPDNTHVGGKTRSNPIRTIRTGAERPPPRNPHCPGPVRQNQLFDRPCPGRTGISLTDVPCPRYTVCCPMHFANYIVHGYIKIVSSFTFFYSFPPRLFNYYLLIISYNTRYLDIYINLVLNFLR